MCPHCGAPTDKHLGHEVPGVYDGALFWSCMSCGRAWSRDWGGYGRRQEIADEYVQQFNHHADDAEEGRTC